MYGCPIALHRDLSNLICSLTIAAKQERARFSKISVLPGDSVMADAVRMGRAQDVPNPNRYGMIGSVLTDLHKFAVDSALNISIKGVTGGKRVYKIMQERLIDRLSPSLNEKKKPEDCRLVGKMQVKIEEIEEEMGNIKQQSTPSSKTVGVSEPLKKTPNGGNKELDFENDNRKRIFIRSRL